MGNLRSRSCTAVVTLILAACLSACGNKSGAAVATPAATAAPTDTATVEVSFQVQVTPAATNRPSTLTPVPTATRFVDPAGPFLRLVPASGPPLSRTIAVHGGHFPVSSTMQIDWSPNGRSSPLSTTAYSDRHGTVSANLAIPAAPPGAYRVVARVDGLIYAITTYHVVSGASLQISGGHTQQLIISGRHFIPGFRLALVAYPGTSGKKYLVLGTVSTDRHGSFRFVYQTRLVPPGQYILRAFSQSTLAAQMAQTVFDVGV